MNASEILEAAKSRFVVLYHREDTALETLLKKALGKYQEKAGVLAKLKVKEGANISLPPHLLDVAVIHDERRVYIPFDIVEGNIELETTPATVYPVSVHYFVDLRSYVGTSEDLPSGCVDLVEDYLHSLIDIPNTERQRAVMLSTKQQATDLPSPQELQARVDTLEQAMEDRQAMVPPVAVY